MVFEKTRALWVELECEARWRGKGAYGKPLIRECHQFWAQQTPTDQSRFIEAYMDWQKALETFTEKQTEAEEAQNEADTIYILPSTNWADYIEKYEGAADLWREAAGLQLQCLEALNSLSLAILYFRVAGPMVNGVNRPVPAHPEVEHYTFRQIQEGRRLMRKLLRNAQEAQQPADEPPMPSHRADNKRKMPVEWVSKQLQEGRKVRRGEVFAAGQPARGNQWQGWRGAWMFNEGAMGYAGLWVHLDGNEQVDDRAVRKDTYWEPHHWNEIQRWWGPVKDPNNRELYEIRCHRMMDRVQSNLQDNNGTQLNVNVPRLRASFLDDAEMMSSITTAFCPFKSLDTLVEKHIEDGNREVPEPFLWRTFHSLAEAGLAMERGHARRPTANTAVTPGHEEIIHRDLKPGNVFLGAPTETFFPSYPTPHLADFGLAFTTTDTDPLNPSAYLDGGGTRGFKAPEMESSVSVPDMQPIDRFRMLAHTNVWCTGMVMYSLASRDDQPWQPYFVGNGEERGDSHGHKVMDLENYTDVFRYLVRDCLRFKPEDRPSWERVLERIEAAIAALDETSLGGMVRARAGVAHPDLVLWHVPVDAYAVGLAFDALPAMDRDM